MNGMLTPKELNVCSKLIRNPLFDSLGVEPENKHPVVYKHTIPFGLTSKKMIRFLLFTIQKIV